MSNTRRSRNKSKIVSKLAHQYIQMGACNENRLLVSKIRNWPLGSKSKDRPLGSKIENRPLGSKIKTRPLGSRIKNWPLVSKIKNWPYFSKSTIKYRPLVPKIENRTLVSNRTMVKSPTRDRDLKLGFVSSINSKKSDISKSNCFVVLPQGF